MKKIKLEKGITLIALIITIVVLLIIAVVTIGAVQESSIITHAQNAKERYQVEKLAEKMKLVEAEMQLENHGSKISVEDILVKYEGEAKPPVSIAANAKSVPENMPAGNYYIITPDKYASNNNENIRRYAKLTSRGEEREENILKDVYVINEQLDIYYIIEANLASQEEVEIDYDAIAQILTRNIINEDITNEEAVDQIKQELEIIDDNVTDIPDLAVSMFFNNMPYVYLYEIDAVYGLDTNTNTFVYLGETGNEGPYNYGRNVKATKTELERIFINKTVADIQEKYNAGTLDDYVLEKSGIITDIVFLDTSDDYIRLSSVTITKEDNEKTISRDDDNYSMYIYSNGEIYYKVEISLGT